MGVRAAGHRAWIAAVCAGVGGPLACCRDDTGSARAPVEAQDGEAPANGQPDEGDGEAVACKHLLLDELTPNAARFAPGALVSLRTSVAAAGEGGACTATLRLVITDLGEVVHEDERRVPIAPGERQEVVLTWQPPAGDFRGYLAMLSAAGSDVELATGIDVSSSPLRYPRYGYLSIFPPEQTAEQSRAIVATLAEHYHLNMFQFYDWLARPEDLIPRDIQDEIEATWTDLFGRTNAWKTITDLVAAVHGENALAMAYVTIYTAREGYEQRSGVSPGWGLFESPDARAQVALAFGGERYLFLFDPSNADWQARMASEYVEAINAAGFDGVHIDQFGPRPTFYRADGTPVELNHTFAPFLETIDHALQSNDPARALCVFNLVDGSPGGYAVQEVASTPACDLLYSEIWYTTDTYEALREYVELLRRTGGGRAVVLAVYAQYGEDVGRILEAEDATLRGTTVASDHPGYSGTGFVAGFDNAGDAIVFQVTQAEDAVVSYVFRYANATRATTTRTLLVDGTALGKVTFGARGRWDEWAFDAWRQERLAAGAHEVTLLHAEDDAGAVNIDRLTLGEFDLDSVLLQNAVIFASGATPIQIGDDVQSLAHEYFPNRSKSLSPALRRALRRQYTFITAHESLLFAPDVVPIDARLGRISAVSEGHSLIASGAGAIYTLLRATPTGDAIHLVNLAGVDNERWRDAAPTPEVQENVVLRYALDPDRAVRDVLWASPDESGTMTPSPLPYAVASDASFVEFEVPRLAYWDVVVVRYRQNGA